jgi:hypothetical protein
MERALSTFSAKTSIRKPGGSFTRSSSMRAIAGVAASRKKRIRRARFMIVFSSPSR